MTSPGCKIESGQISHGRLLDGFLLVRRELRLQLVGDGFDDLALNGEYIGQVAIIGLRPQMRVVAGIESIAHSPESRTGARQPPLEAIRKSAIHRQHLQW